MNISPNKMWCYRHRVRAAFVFFYAGDCGCSRCSLGAILSLGETAEQFRGLEKGHQEPPPTLRSKKKWLNPKLNPALWYFKAPLLSAALQFSVCVCSQRSHLWKVGSVHENARRLPIDLRREQTQNSL